MHRLPTSSPKSLELVSVLALSYCADQLGKWEYRSLGEAGGFWGFENNKTELSK